MFRAFPKDFLWGTATAAQQIEGGMSEEGRGLSIWDVFSRIPGKISNSGLPDRSCDSYHLFARDVEMMKELGINSYRFSFSWPRIIPDGKGNVNWKGIDYYKHLIELLLKNGIQPNATMYHWDLPYQLQAQGGFGNREVIKWFTHYAEVLLDTFGSIIPYWVTVNEPIATYVGTAEGFFAPGVSDEIYGRQCIHNLLLCHGETVKIFREKQIRNSNIGIVVDVWKHYPFRRGNENDEKKALYNNEIVGYGMFLHPLFLGGYSDFLQEYMEKNGIVLDIRDGDFETICQPLDFYGLNFYNGLFDCADETEKKVQQKEGGNYQDRAETHTEVLPDVLRMLKQKYHINIPIILTENGISQLDPGIAADESSMRTSFLDDQMRIDYVKNVLTYLHDGMKEGADVRGYYLWSLMDNFEWTAGYTERFGLYYTDFQTLERIPKKSAFWYAETIKRGGFDE